MALWCWRQDLARAELDQQRLERVLAAALGAGTDAQAPDAILEKDLPDGWTL